MIKWLKKKREEKRMRKLRSIGATFDPWKLPKWNRDVNDIKDVDKYMVERKRLCAEGKHVPVQGIYPDGSIDYFCQECATELTKEDHERFFRNARFEVMG